MKDLNIPSIDEIQEETATSTDYYGEQRINAKGYTLVDCLSIYKDTNEATYSTFNYERQSDEESIPCTLSLQGNNIYLLTPDNEIIEDITNNGGNMAEQVLKTTNDSLRKKIAEQ